MCRLTDTSRNFGSRGNSGTPRVTIVSEIKPGKYIHFGLRKGLLNRIGDSDWSEISFDLNVGFVTDIPFEYLHLVLLGGTKKLLNVWAHSSSFKGSLSRQQLNQLSRNLTNQLTILEARQKANRIVESDASSTDTEAPRKRKLPVRFAESSNSAKRAKHVSRTQTHLATASFPSPPPKALQSTNEQIVSTSRTVPHVPIGINSAEQLPTKDSENGFEKLVLAGIAVLKVRIRAIQDAQTIILEQIRELRSTNALPGRVKKVKLPVESLEDLDGLEVKIGSDPDAYSDLANSLDWIGGRTVRRCTNNALRKLMTDKVAQQLNWKGANEKRAFKSFEVCTILIESDWLKAAPTRFKRQLGQTRGEEIPLDEERDEEDSLLN
ncbi:unnamed protein product [Allacma fusca]|uniref:DUF4806 domain-containing protein n=1 Tax=Allacma fusca TaxID=39272 RepID=A0A8J2LAN0_9HEXA|nr:unnamed protein product [Allacma fusca]